MKLKSIAKNQFIWWQPLSFVTLRLNIKNLNKSWAMFYSGANWGPPRVSEWVNKKEKIWSANWIGAVQLNLVSLSSAAPFGLGLGWGHAAKVMISLLPLLKVVGVCCPPKSHLICCDIDCALYTKILKFIALNIRLFANYRLESSGTIKCWVGKTIEVSNQCVLVGVPVYTTE